MGSTGLATLLPLAKLVGTYYIALTAFALLVMVPVLAMFRVPLGKFFSAVSEPAPSLSLSFAARSNKRE